MERFGGRLEELSIPELLTDDNEKNLFQDLTAYPELWELAGLSSHVTHQDFKLEEGGWIHWIIIADAIDTKSKYHGTAYYNTFTRHLVIPYSGTNDWQSRRDDFMVIYLKSFKKFKIKKRRNWENYRLWWLWGYLHAPQELANQV